jgi:hypothetical protein
VLAEGGEPVAGAEVLLRSSAGPSAGGLLGSWLAGRGELQRARSDPGGAFRFPRLREGTYELAARPRGPAQDALGPSETLRLELADGEREEHLELALRPALSLAGRVVDEVGGVVVGAAVVAEGEARIEGRAARARTDDQGRFTLRGLAPGRHVVTARADGFAPGAGVEVELGSAGELERGELLVRLERGMAVRVRILSRTGSPVAGARARLERAGDPALEERELEGMLRGFLRDGGGSDDEGRLELGRYGPGEYELSVWSGLTRSERIAVVLPEGGGSIELLASLP